MKIYKLLELPDDIASHQLTEETRKFVGLLPDTYSWDECIKIARSNLEDVEYAKFGNSYFRIEYREVN